MKNDLKYFPMSELSGYDKLLIKVNYLKDNTILVRLNLRTEEIFSFLSQPEIEKIEEVLKSLPDIEEFVVRLKFGLHGIPAMNYREISDKLNKSPSRIGQIFKNGMKKLRHPSRIDLLPDLSKSAFNKRQARLEQREIELLLFYQEIITALKNEGVQNLAENHFIFQMASFKFSIPINELKMSIRSYNYLHNARIETVGELVKKTEVEMLKILNFGRKSLAEVKLILAEMNLSFGMKF